LAKRTSYEAPHFAVSTLVPKYSSQHPVLQWEIPSFIPIKQLVK